MDSVPPNRSAGALAPPLWDKGIRADHQNALALLDGRTRGKKSTPAPQKNKRLDQCSWAVRCCLKAPHDMVKCGSKTNWLVALVGNKKESGAGFQGESWLPFGSWGPTPHKVWAKPFPNKAVPFGGRHRCSSGCSKDRGRANNPSFYKMPQCQLCSERSPKLVSNVPEAVLW